MDDGRGLMPPVPDRFTPALEELSRLPDVQYEALMGVLEQEELRSSRESLLDAMQSGVQGLSRRDARSIEALAVAFAQASRPDRPPGSSVARNVAWAENLDLDDTRRSRLAERLDRLLAAPGILLNAKAVQLAYDRERHLQNAAVICDLRPVFRQDLSAPPAGYIVNHALRVRYSTGLSNDDSRIEFSLDLDDLQMMRDEIDRAIRKHKALQVTIGEAGWSTYEAWVTTSG